jgi:hypothetical protein
MIAEIRQRYTLTDFRAIDDRAMGRGDDDRGVGVAR